MLGIAKNLHSFRFTHGVVRLMVLTEQIPRMDVEARRILPTQVVELGSQIEI